MLSIKNFTLFTNETLIYEANASFSKGTVYGFSARNGSGKTTLLRAISGLSKSFTGNISIKENNRELDSLERKQASFYYEIVEWFDVNLSGLDYLKFVHSAWGNQSYTSVDELIYFWDMTNYIKEPIKKYSLGMKQKVLLSLYAASGANYWFLDEPTLGLDTNSLEQFKLFILDAKENGKCILFSSHQNDSMYDICDYVYEINNKALSLINNKQELDK